MSDTKKIIRREYKFTGYVQGVGFRYRARHFADGLGITGWVMNEWDGSVLMQAQGTEAQLNELLTQINRGSYISIDRIEYKELPTEDTERSFHVRY
ncbi:MAG: acylphosphatase [Eubacteriales bacterium]|nr:acylphosphatase [Eubacteriales bacterium]